MTDAKSPEDRFAERLRGFGPVGVLAILAVLAGNFLFLPLSAILVLIWVQASRTPWREIGYVRPKSWILDAAIGIVCGVAFKLVMKAIVMPLLGADPVNHAYHYIAGNPAALPGAILMMIVGGGIGEETVYRGFLFERLGKLLGSSVGAKIAIVVGTSLLFASAHYAEQGIYGSVQASMTGLVFGTIYASTGRLWLLMFLHAAFDLAAVAIIYNDLETEVAHWVFG